MSLGAVSLTITSYLIIQGISPLFWGPLSDILGRRVIYIASFSTYIVANIGLSFSPNFAALLIFRGLQSAGSASTVSIGTSSSVMRQHSIMCKDLTRRRKWCYPGHRYAARARRFHQLLSGQ